MGAMNSYRQDSCKLLRFETVTAIFVSGTSDGHTLLTNLDENPVKNSETNKSTVSCLQSWLSRLVCANVVLEIY
ncbi:unnamed protein product [Musa textilis]